MLPFNLLSKQNLMLPLGFARQYLFDLQDLISIEVMVQKPHDEAVIVAAPRSLVRCFGPVAQSKKR